VFNGEKGSFIAKFVWNNIPVKLLSISEQNYQIVFSGLPFQDIFPLNKFKKC